VHRAVPGGAALSMRVQYDPRLVEAVVHMLAQESRIRWLRYRRKIDRLYESDDRGRAFDEAHIEFFRGWEASAPCEEALASVVGVERAVVARSLHPSDEGVDLLAGNGFTVSMRLTAERFLEPDSLRRFLKHEMRHVHDMLDPEFGYQQNLSVKGRTHAERELVRGRYRVLWNLAIDAVEPSPVDADARRAELACAFAALDESQREKLAAMYADPKRRTHKQLAEAARDPWAVLGEPRTAGHRPGEPCPLCGFPTYDWDEAPPREAILADLPDWQEDIGACRQCGDMYRAHATAAHSADA